VRNVVRELREDRGWTQAELADQLDVSRQTVHSIEKGKYSPSLPLAFKISQVFGRPIEEVFSPEGDG
jgi:putative transcriptional regulator